MDFIQEAKSIQEVELAKIKSSLDEYSFACIRGLINVYDVNFAMENLRNRFSRKDDHPVIGERPSDIRKNFQKLLVSGISQTTNVHITRFFRVTYNPLWEEDIYHMHKLFHKIAHLRNKIAGLPDCFALERIEDNQLWTASRIQQYPIGGGYFASHTDFVAEAVSRNADTSYYQIILNMTQKGIDYETGGAFVIHQGKKIDIDSKILKGDILIYDGRTEHGVDEIDPHKNLDIDNFSARVVALASLYDTR